MQTISQFKVAVPLFKFGTRLYVYQLCIHNGVHVLQYTSHPNAAILVYIYITSNPKNRYSYKNSVKMTMSFNFNIFNLD